MGCTEGLARILVFVANFAFLLVGLTLLVVGVLYKINYTHYTQAIPDDYSVIQTIPTIAIVVGAVIFVIAFLGCCGALKSSTCMLTTYGSILFLIFLAQVALGIFALITIKNNDELNNKVHNAIFDLFERYNSNSRNSTEVVDLLQKELKCCGVDGPSYWILKFNTVPDSCKSSNGIPFSQGCTSAFVDFLQNSVKIIAIVALAVSITEVVGAVLAFCLSNCIRGRERQGVYY